MKPLVPFPLLLFCFGLKANNYYQVSKLAAGYGVGFVVEPSSSVVYRLLCGGNAASLSRLCGILARYKKEWEKQRARSRATGRIQLEGVSITNSYIWDLCNSLWRGNLFPAHPSGTVKSRFLPLPYVPFSYPSHVVTCYISLQPGGDKGPHHRRRGQLIASARECILYAGPRLYYEQHAITEGA